MSPITFSRGSRAPCQQGVRAALDGPEGPTAQLSPGETTRPYTGSHGRRERRTRSLHSGPSGRPSATRPRGLAPLPRQAWFPQEPSLSKSAREPSYELWEKPLKKRELCPANSSAASRSARRKCDEGAEVGSDQGVPPWSELPM